MKRILLRYRRYGNEQPNKGANAPRTSLFTGILITGAVLQIPR